MRKTATSSHICNRQDNTQATTKSPDNSTSSTRPRTLAQATPAERDAIGRLCESVGIPMLIDIGPLPAGRAEDVDVDSDVAALEELDAEGGAL